jgi:phage shock protein PspC (stress-responsive transcriptional regulator)
MSTNKTTETKREYKKEYKKLFRSRENRVLAGVCGGLAEFFNVDPIIFRLIFVVVTLMGGSGILIYLILWLLIPSSQGEARITEESLRKSADEIKDKAQELADNFKGYTKENNSKKIISIILIVIGILFLFNNFGFYHYFSFLWKLWPLFLIGLAILLLKNEK